MTQPQLTVQQILRAVDHTNLDVCAGWQQIRTLCDEALEFGTASVCIAPCWVHQAVQYLQHRVPVCTVVGFPNGYATTAAKCFETRQAVENGAEEIDMVINLGWLQDGALRQVQAEIEAVRLACPEQVLKVIVETCRLTEQQKIEMCRIVTASGADYIKTSTGFGAGGATFADIRLFAEHVGSNVKIKAAGGISSLQDARTFLQLGAHRLGTSRLVRLAREELK